MKTPSCHNCNSKPCPHNKAMIEFVDASEFKGSVGDFENDSGTLLAKHCRDYCPDYTVTGKRNK